MRLAWRRRRGSAAVLGVGTGLLLAACGNVQGMDPGDPARGPGQLVGNGDPVTDGNFAGGSDAMPAPRDVVPPAPGQPLDCDSECRAYCDGLGLENPVNVGLCGSAWGVGLALRPVDRAEACRRVYADFVGRFPTPTEIADVCSSDRSWGDVVSTVLDSDEYVLVNQRRWADKLLYNNRAVSFERAYDMDELVGKTYRGRVAWDEFAAVASAHPVVMRRHDTPGDRAEFVFKLFLGRPPYEAERADLGRMYRLWTNGYWTHPHVGVVPDAFIDFACVDAEGRPDSGTIGECTSIQWGYQELTLAPDVRRTENQGEQEGTMWAGYLTADEWKTLQLPGRTIAKQPAFWETTVDDAIGQYFGYALGSAVPEVRHELVRHLLRYDGDIRSLHHAIATSFAYLQSAEGASATDLRWTYGPLKQIQVEGWIDSIARTTGVELGQCDHRLPHPEDYLGEEALEEAGGWAYALVNLSRWDIDDEREVVNDYRNLASTLGGCPSNEVGGRFTTVSVLNTAVQEAFVAELCGIGGDGIEVERLLPEGVTPRQALDPATAQAILAHQQRLFLGRSLDDAERTLADEAATTCTPAPCDAQTFARPACFALLSSSEMLFY
jgi:hypothetical protein